MDAESIARNLLHQYMRMTAYRSLITDSRSRSVVRVPSLEKIVEHGGTWTYEGGNLNGSVVTPLTQIRMPKYYQFRTASAIKAYMKAAKSVAKIFAKHKFHNNFTYDSQYFFRADFIGNKHDVSFSFSFFFFLLQRLRRESNRSHRNYN